MTIIVLYGLFIVELIFLFAFRDVRDEDRTLLRLISPELLHIFDQTMSLIPFATKTDMYEALKAADVKVANVETFLAGLRLEHSMANARTQLIDLWKQHATAYFPEESKDMDVTEEGGKVFSATVPTPPSSPKDGDGS